MDAPADAPAIEYFDASTTPTVVVRATDYPVARLAELFDATFSAMFPALAERGIAPAGAPFSLHTRIPSETVDIEVGIPLTAPLDGPFVRGDITLLPSTLPAGTTARTTYLGPYDGLGGAWGGFMGAIVESGRAPAFPFWEVYVTEPTPDADPTLLRTDLFTLVAAPE